MSHTLDQPGELQDLLDLLVEDELDSVGLDQLNEILRSDPQAQQVYLHYLSVHADLCWDAVDRPSLSHDESGVGVGSATAAWDDALMMRDVPQSIESTGTVKKTISYSASWFKSFTPSVACSVILVAMGFYGTFSLIAWNLRPELFLRHDNNTIADVPPDMPARLIASQNAEWAGNLPSRRLQSEMRPRETLQIIRGMVELEMGRGVRLLIEAPAVWSIDGANEATLRSGKLVARVPHQAIGFRVKTPTVEIVDLGTEFGVEVSPDRSVEVHVIKGAVATTIKDSSRTGPHVVRLAERQALRVTQVAGVDRTAVARIAMAADKFPRGSGNTIAKSIPRKAGGVSADAVLSIDFGCRSKPYLGNPLQDGFELFLLDGKDTSTTRSYPGNMQVTVSKVGQKSVLDDWFVEATPIKANGFELHDLFCDMLLADNGEADCGLEVEVVGLTPLKQYEVTVWSADPGVKGTRLADWHCNGILVVDDYDSGGLPAEGGEPRTNLWSFRFSTTADEQGRIALRGSHVGGVGTSVVINGMQITAVE